jgi:predicted RNA-binding Zn-ribbon protein involved in translation (DUF1610 family)
MPFVPLTPEEARRACLSKQHSPPGHIVITKATKWRCPDCGHEVVIYPSQPSHSSDGGLDWIGVDGEIG